MLHPFDADFKLLHEAFPKPDLAGVRLYDYVTDPSGKQLPPQWIGRLPEQFRDRVQPGFIRGDGIAPPQTWSDLTDPRLSGAVALADPTHSGSVSVAYMMILQRSMADAEKEFFSLPANVSRPKAELMKLPEYRSALAAGWKKGMGQLLLIAANARYFSDSSTQIPNDVASGDAAAGMAIDFYGRVTSETVGPRRCLFVTPPAATAITPDPVAILYGTRGRQLELANHFIEFLLSRQGQRLWILKAGQPGGPRQRACTARRSATTCTATAPAGPTTSTILPGPATSISERRGWRRWGICSRYGRPRGSTTARRCKAPMPPFSPCPMPSGAAGFLSSLADLPISMQQVDD